MPAKKKAPAPATPAKSPANKKTATATAASTGAGAGAGNGCTAVDVDAHGANTMPTVGRKAASVKAKAELCVLCCKKAMECKEDVLFCSGKCNGPIHRYCAGISLPQFESLKSDLKNATDRVSFLCLACTQQAYREEVCELRSTVAALKMQIQELGDALKSTVAGHHTNCNTSNSVSSYAAAVNQGNQGIGGTGGGGRNGGSGGCGRAGGRGDHGSSGRNGGSGGGERTGGRSIHGGSGRNGGSGGGGRAGGRGTRGGHEGNGGLVGSGQRGDNRYGSGAIGREVGHKTKDGVSSGKAVQREVVSGVRRLWGTVKSASHFSVKNTIVKLAKVENVDSIQVKRKQETTRTGKPKWWYVIHAEEDAILKPLETKWENVNIQTGWHLEPCTKPVEDTTLAPLAHSNQDNGVDTGVLSNGTNQPCNEDAPTDTIVLSTSIVTNTCPPGEPDQLFDISSPRTSTSTSPTPQTGSTPPISPTPISNRQPPASPFLDT